MVSPTPFLSAFQGLLRLDQLFPGKLGNFTDEFTTCEHLARVDLSLSKVTHCHWVSGLKHTHQNHVTLSLNLSPDPLST